MGWVNSLKRILDTQGLSATILKADKETKEETMNIYRLQNSWTSDCIVEAIVVAEDENAARNIHPEKGSIYPDGSWGRGDWPVPSEVIVTLLGEADSNIPFKPNAVIMYYDSYID